MLLRWFSVSGIVANLRARTQHAANTSGFAVHSPVARASSHATVSEHAAAWPTGPRANRRGHSVSGLGSTVNVSTPVDRSMRERTWLYTSIGRRFSPRGPYLYNTGTRALMSVSYSPLRFALEKKSTN